jgi:hypothetical protein
VAEFPATLPKVINARFTADPARWLLKARSPLVKFRAAVDLLDWPRDADEPAGWWLRRYEDPDLAAVAAAQEDDGLWHAPGRFFGRRLSLYVPKYLAAVWQLPVLADLGLSVAEATSAKAVTAILAARTADGFFDLGRGGPFVRGNAWVVSSLARLGVGGAELAAARQWLASRQRPDGGWADDFEVDVGAPSTVGTSAEVLRALGGADGAAHSAARERGRAYLRANFFTDYNGRFPPSSRPWRRLSWPQFRYDALSVATSLAAAGASREEVTPLAAAVRGLETRRGFWRQQVPIAEPCWLAPVRAGRASRWVTLRAAAFLVWFYAGAASESDCDVS